MKKIKNNFIYLLIGFCVVLGVAMIYGSKGKNSDIESNKKIKNPVNTPDKSNNPKSSDLQDNAQSKQTGVTQKTDNPPAGVVPDVSNLPATASDYYQLGLANLSKSKWDQSIVEFTEAINLDGTNPNYYLKKSEAQYKLGQKDQAIETVRAGLQKIPGNTLLQDQLDILNSL